MASKAEKKKQNDLQSVKALLNSATKADDDDSDEELAKKPVETPVEEVKEESKPETEAVGETAGEEVVTSEPVEDSEAAANDETKGEDKEAE